MLRLSSLAPLLLAFAACGSDPIVGGPGGGAPDMRYFVRPELGTPIVAPVNTWTWVDFPESTCDEGTATGIGVNLSTSKNVIVFLNGGGACWDYTTCFVLNTAVKGPFTSTQFNALFGGGAGSGTGTIFDRSDASNPFRDWNMVFVPYCTGDVHAGDNDTMYAGGGNPPRAYHHKGHANFLAFMKRIAGTLPEPERAVLAGSSAGGFGATFNYDSFRQYYPHGKDYLLDDSGPPLIGDEIPPNFRSLWYSNWHLAQLLDPLCPDCRTDLSQLAVVLGKKYPNDRATLLSSMQDRTIRGYFLKSAPAFQADLLDVSKTVLDTIPSFHYFFVPGETHTMLGGVKAFTATDGTSLQTFLTQMVSDDPAWTSHKP